MKLIISFCAPAVMDNIATTAPTPKIMPSMVSRLRSLCASRLENPIASSGRYPEKGFMLFAALGSAAGWHAGQCSRTFLSGVFPVRFRERIGQGDYFAGL